MKNKKVLGKNMTFLIVGILAVMSFIRGNTQFWYLVGVFVIWAIWTLILLSKKGRVKKILDKKEQFLEIIKNLKDKANDLTSAKSETDATLLRHLNCRISDYLKSVYPEITWEWVTENPEKLGSIRNRVFA